MDTELLNTFLAVARNRSFTLAARELRLTQPAVSKRIDRLEQLLGTSLFDRIGPHVLLTDAGKLLLDKAPGVLVAVEDCQRQISDLGGSVSGSLSIGTSHYIGLHRLPPVLLKFQEAFPRVDLQLEFIDSEQAYEMVLAGTIEMALMTLPENRDSRVVTQVLWQEELQLVCHEDYPLACKKRISRQDFSDYPCILPGAHSFPRDLFEARLRSNRIPVGQVKSAHYLEIIAKLVAAKLGWGLLPETLVKAPLVTLDLAGTAMRRDLGLLYRTNRTLSNAARSLLAMLQA